MQMGIVSARHVDHVGLVVPDLDAAIDFFEQALGALLLWRVGPFEETPTGVPIESVTLAMLRLGPSLNVELQAFVADTQRQESPSNIDIGAGHIAFFVNDIQAAAQSLRDNGAELLRGPINAKGDIKTPWGGFMEILWRPDGLPYENQTPFRLYQPNDSWADED
jgi:catechol 2,3-dioxygenase-like lactoylglutathione lyase family enzyme